MSRLAFTLLLLLSCLNLIAVSLDLPTLRGLALASAAAPAPKVFTAHAGLEGFSSRYVLTVRNASGDTREVVLTPALYERLQGPYNRRNPYGAIVAAGPLLHSNPRTKDAFAAVARFALCGRAPLLAELGVAQEYRVGPHTLTHRTRDDAESTLPLSIEVVCP